MPMTDDYAATEPTRAEIDALQGPTLLEFGSVSCGWCIRAEAAHGLGRLRLPECQAPLLTLARDVEPAVANAAREALAPIRKAGSAAA